MITRAIQKILRDKKTGPEELLCWLGCFPRREIKLAETEKTVF